MAARMGRQLIFFNFLDFPRLPCCLCLKSRQSSAQVAKTDTGQKEIVIPKRKKRDATALLRALSSTVGKDPLAAHYTFVDDPMLIPVNHDQKRLWAMTKAAGRRAARFMMSEVPEAFTRDDAAPHIKAYDPDVTEYQHTQPTEEALLERIEFGRVVHAMEVYKMMKQLGVTASPSTLQSLLELLCMYNHQDPPQFYAEERQFLLPKDLDRESTWQNGCLAEEVFDDLPEKTADAYNAMIRGMFKHKNAERGFKLYEEMKAHNLPVYKRTYIEILERAGHVYGVQAGRLDDHGDKGQRYWDLVLSLLREMKENNIPPNHATFTAVLKSIDISRVANKLDKLNNVLNEMHRLGIEPALADWSIVLNIVFRATGSHNQLQCMKVILGELEKKPLQVNKIEDAQFFLTAMLKISDNLSNTKLAIELNELRESAGSSLTLRAQDDFLYCKHFMTMLMRTEPADVVMKEYSKIVPHVYVPSAEVYWSLVDCLKLHSELKYMPQVWEDILLICNKGLNKLAAHVFSAISEKKVGDELQKEFVQMAKTMYTYWTTSVEWAATVQALPRVWGVQTDVINGEVFGYLIEIALNAGDFDMAWNYFSSYKEHMDEFRDRPKDRAYQALFKACFSSRDPEKIMAVVNAMSDQAVPVLFQLIDEAKEELDSILDYSQRSVIDKLC